MASRETTTTRVLKEITSIIGNRPLAAAIHRSVTAALDSRFVRLTGGQTKTVWDIFKHSLDAAVRDIEQHPRGDLFRRLLEYGPLNPDDPETLVNDGKTTLSDPECGQCVEFIFSHMVNRFKGELAELLALEPCIRLIQELRRQGRLPRGVRLYWGETVEQRRTIGPMKARTSSRWGGFTKGADGLLVEHLSTPKGIPQGITNVCGVIEVKSMYRSDGKVLDQIDKHLLRLKGGLRLQGKEFVAGQLSLAGTAETRKAGQGMIRVMVMPARWRLSRDWRSVKNDKGRVIVLPEPTEPETGSIVTDLTQDLWKIALAWSEEALSEAAYEMTFWYMSQVGKHIFTNKELPRGWEYMTPEQAGHNAIKMMLYYVPLRYISKRHERLAIRLYNVYAFGYPLGVASRKMLWPKDFPDDER